MTAFMIANIAQLTVRGTRDVLLLGYPVAFSHRRVGIAFGLLGIEIGLMQEDTAATLTERIGASCRTNTLLAGAVLYIMGLILERSGMADDLLDTIGSTLRSDSRRTRLRGDLRRRVTSPQTGVVAASVI